MEVEKKDEEVKYVVIKVSMATISHILGSVVGLIIAILFIKGCM